MNAIGVGFVLHPHGEYLALCREIIEQEADFFEVSPETLWRLDDANHLVASPWAKIFEEFKKHSGKPFVAHGLGLSPGTAATNDQETKRLDRWLTRIRDDHARFGFLWYTEHLGWVNAEGLQAVLPLPLPATDESVAVVSSRLTLLKPIIDTVGFENQVSYFGFGDTREEPPFWNRICAAGNLWLLLDLHNAYTQCLNAGIPLSEYLDAIDLSRVIEIHLSGGSESEPGWLPSGRVMRLDTHDGPVPKPVWDAFASIRPRCKNLRGVVVERLNGTLRTEDVRPLRDEVRRARRIFFETPSC